MSQDLANTYMILIPKPESNKMRGIGIVDTLWKVIAYIIKRRLEAKIQLHSDLHGFRKGHGCRTAIFKTKYGPGIRKTITRRCIKHS